MAPRPGHQFKSLSDRLFEKVSPEPNSGCWLWVGADNGAGYGTMTMGRSSRAYAHRVSYEMHKGPIPEGLFLDHLCRVRCCVNPDHLEPVTNRENCRRGLAGSHMSKKTECVRGHQFAQHGYTDSQGNRQCRICHKIRMKAYRERKGDVH